MDLRKAFGTNHELEQKGVWIAYDDSCAFLIGRIGGSNDTFSRRVNALLKPHRHQVQADTLPPEKYQSIAMAAFVETVLLDWKGVELDGEELPFTKENALKLFRELPDLFNDLFNQAKSTANFRAVELEEDTKN